MNMNRRDIYFLPSVVLLILGLLDLLRGFMHTFNINWAAANIARLNLSVAREDQLVLLGAFGISNILTGILYILLSRKSKELAPYIIIIIPACYLAGYIGLKFSGVRMNSEFNGKYFMLVYLALCIFTFIKFLYDKQKEKAINHE